MKKFIVILMAISLMALAVPALAGGTKNVTINKEFNFHVNGWIDPKALAECDVWKCDINAANNMQLFASLFVDEIFGSFTGFIGIGQANQAAGYSNNQGNIVAAALVNEKEAAAMTEVKVGQGNFCNDLDASLTISIDKISCSFNAFQGIGQANQSAGSMNNQNNVVAISAGLGDSCYGSDLVATNDTYLTQANTRGDVKVCFVANSNSVSSSFNNFTGIGQVNQSAGSMNNQANIVSIAYVGPRP